MPAEPMESIDVSDLPDVLEVVERIRVDAKAKLLRRGDEALAFITPIAPTSEPSDVGPGKRRRRVQREVTQADLDAFWSAVGSWQGNVDVDRFLTDNEQSRRISSRPAVEW